MSFLDKLAEEKIIKQSELEEISLRLAEGNTDVDDILIAKGVKEDVIVKLKSEYSNVPMRRIDIKAISFDVLKYIPEESATYYKFVPIGVTQGVLEVGLWIQTISILEMRYSSLLRKSECRLRCLLFQNLISMDN